MKSKKIILSLLCLIIVVGVGLNIFLSKNSLSNNIDKALKTQLTTDELNFIIENNYIEEADISVIKDNNAKLKGKVLNKKEFEKIKTSQADIYKKITIKINEEVITLDEYLDSLLSEVVASNVSDSKTPEEISKVIKTKLKDGSDYKTLSNNIKIMKDKLLQEDKINAYPTDVADMVIKDLNKFDEDELLKGNFTSLRGLWVNNCDQTLQINADSTIIINGKNDSDITFSKDVDYNIDTNIYGWLLLAPIGGAGVTLYQPGVKFMNYDSDETRLRIYIGQSEPIDQNSTCLFERENNGAK